VRNSAGAAIYATRGINAAAHALGDTESAVLNHYGFLDGNTVTESLLRDAAALAGSAATATATAP
jgi:hypothetical protein